MSRTVWDTFSRFDLVIAGRRMGSWIVMGRSGAFVGATCFVVGGLQTTIPLSLVALVIASNVVSFAVLQATSRKWRNGRYVLLEHVVAAAMMTAAVTLAHDYTLTSLFAMWLPCMTVTLAFGRIGCLMSGCCHGQVSHWGMRYPWQLPWIAGGAWWDLRVAPLQAIEAAILAALAIFGFLARHDPVLIVSALPSIYAVARFELEFWRGDARRQIGPLSHNQWWCAMNMVLVATIGEVHLGVVGVAFAVARLFLRRHRLCPAIALSSVVAFRQVEHAIANARAGTPADLNGTRFELRDGVIRIDARRTALSRSATRVLERVATVARPVAAEVRTQELEGDGPWRGTSGPPNRARS